MSISPAELSAEFEVLIPSDQESDSSDKSQQNFITLEYELQQTFTHINYSNKLISYSFLQENTIVIVDSEISLLLSTQEWQEFIKKKQEEIAELMENDGLRTNKGMTRMTIYEKSSVVGVKNDDLNKRRSLWQIANYYSQLEKEYENKQRQSQEMKENIITILSYELSQNQMSNLRKSAFKINKVLKQIEEYKDSNVDAMRIVQHEKEIMQWIYDTLMRFAVHDQQIRYCKGIQYVCLGIIVAYPQFNLNKYTQLFYHFMNIHRFRELYLEGSPKYFEELHSIKEYIKNTKPQLYITIQDLEGDYKNLFISYFRSCLIYKIKNPEIIRKLFELLFIEGTSLITSIILRIIEVSTPNLLKNENILQTLSSQLILDYFSLHQKTKEKEQIGVRIERLFLS